jgi:hypothetical protein
MNTSRNSIGFADLFRDQFQRFPIFQHYFVRWGTVLVLVAVVVLPVPVVPVVSVHVLVQRYSIRGNLFIELFKWKSREMWNLPPQVISVRVVKRSFLNFSALNVVVVVLLLLLLLLLVTTTYFKNNMMMSTSNTTPSQY